MKSYLRKQHGLGNLCECFICGGSVLTNDIGDSSVIEIQQQDGISGAYVHDNGQCLNKALRWYKLLGDAPQVDRYEKPIYKWIKCTK